MQSSGEDAGHHLRAGVVARGAVALAVDDEAEVVAGEKRDAALAAVLLEDGRLRLLFIHSRSAFGVVNIARAAGADAGVPPDRRRPERRTSE